MGRLARSISPLTVSLFFARAAIMRPRPAKTMAPRLATAMRATGIPAREPRKSATQTPEGPAALRPGISRGSVGTMPEEVTAAHGGCCEPLDELSRSHLDDRIAHPPRSRFASAPSRVAPWIRKSMYREPASDTGTSRVAWGLVRPAARWRTSLTMRRRIAAFGARRIEHVNDR